MQKISFYFKHPGQFWLTLLIKYGIWLPDKLFLKMRFLLEMGSRLKLKNPKTFQEKIQWLKLYNRNPEYTLMVDKYAVKNYIAGIIGNQYVIPTIGVWDNPNEIDFDSLPNQFVLKTTHGGGGGGVIICRDKLKLDIENAKLKLQKSLNSDIYKNYREWPYKNVPKRIIAEKYFEISGKSDLTDYKIFCFNGVPKFIQVIQDRNTKETIDFFDTEWNHMEFVGLNPKCMNAKETPSKPKDLYEMIKIAEKLAKNTPFVRIDLYNIDSKIYFGELTFYPASGFGKFTPYIWSDKLGDLIQLNDAVWNSNQDL